MHLQFFIPQQKEHDSSQCTLRDIHNSRSSLDVGVRRKENGGIKITAKNGRTFISSTCMSIGFRWWLPKFSNRRPDPLKTRNNCEYQQAYICRTQWLITKTISTILLCKFFQVPKIRLNSQNWFEDKFNYQRDHSQIAHS